MLAPVLQLFTRPWRLARGTAPAGVALLALAASGAAHAAVPTHDVLDDLLLRHVRDGFVDYDGIRADGRLPAYLEALAATEPQALTDPQVRKAFYINAYNALAIHGVLAGYSTDGGRDRARFFKRLKQPIAGEPVSLDMIERDVLRPMGDPRIHFAIVGAALSCPRLHVRAYEPGSLDAALDEAARRFVNDPTRNRYDVNRRRAFLSSVFDSFAADFERSGGSLQRFMAPYADDASIAALLREDGFEVRFQPYDWGLNGRHDGGG